MVEIKKDKAGRGDMHPPCCRLLFSGCTVLFQTKRGFYPQAEDFNRAKKRGGPSPLPGKRENSAYRTENDEWGERGKCCR